MKIAKTVYYPRQDFEGSPPGEKSAILSLGLGITGYALVGRSATTIWQLPNIDTRKAFVPEVRGRRRAPCIDLHMRNVSSAEIRSVTWSAYDFFTASPAMAVVDVARWHGLREAVEVGDILVRNGKTSQDEILACARLRSGSRKQSVAVEAAGLINNRSESVRESDVKVTLHNLGFSGFVQQAEIFSTVGVFLGRGDFFFPDFSVAVEYDGRGKTHGEFGVSPESALHSERYREKLLLDEGVRLVHVTGEMWRDEDWTTTLARIIQANRGNVFPASQWRPASIRIPN